MLRHTRKMLYLGQARRKIQHVFFGGRGGPSCWMIAVGRAWRFICAKGSSATNRRWGRAIYIYIYVCIHMAMGHNLWLHFGLDEHPFATYFDVHQGYRVLTHSHISAERHVYLNRLHSVILHSVFSAGKWFTQNAAARGAANLLAQAAS